MDLLASVHPAPLDFQIVQIDFHKTKEFGEFVGVLRRCRRLADGGDPRTVFSIAKTMAAVGALLSVEGPVGPGSTRLSCGL